MGHLNSKQLEKWMCFLLARDGYYCKGCNKPLYELLSKAVIDHIDNDDSNNPPDGTNYQILCHSCNTLKANSIQNKIEDRPYTPEMKLNLKAEPKWVNWMINSILENKSVCHGEAIADGAEIVGVSTETTKRYLKKRLGKNGLFDLGWGKCKSILCDETHVYEKGHAPKLE